MRGLGQLKNALASNSSHVRFLSCLACMLIYCAAWSPSACGQQAARATVQPQDRRSHSPLVAPAIFEQPAGALGLRSGARSKNSRSAAVRSASAMIKPTGDEPLPAPVLRTHDASSTGIDQSDAVIDPDYIHGTWDDSCDAGCDACGSRVGCVCDPVGYLLDWSRCDLSVGATSFATASNFLTTGQSGNGQLEGSFGFQESINFGSRAIGLLNGQVGAQLGLRAIQSQLEGSAAGADSRNQLFLTAGLYRRVDYGVQGGLVIDYMHEDSLFAADLLQLRGELSYMLTACHEAGFRFTSSQRTAETTARINGLAAPITVKLSALDTYRFFYRVRLGENGRGSAELHGGFSEDRDGILGLGLSTPLQGSVGLGASMVYLFPHSGANPTYASESWNLGVSMIWTPGRAFGTARDYYRPLFDVADNGSMLHKLRP